MKDRRYDIVATALTFGETVDDLPILDPSYDLPYSTAIDIVVHGTNILSDKINGIAEAITPMEVKNKI